MSNFENHFLRIYFKFPLNVGICIQFYSFLSTKVYKTLPDGITFEEVVGLISTYPSKTSANLFGMSEDAEIACQQLRAQSLVDTLTSVQPIISSTFGG